jgi:copper transport protein
VKALLVAVVAALVLPAAAAAHANLVRTSPENGAVLEQAPRQVRIVFDDDVHRASGNEVVRNGGGSVLAGDGRVVGGRTLVLPLRRGLADGAYSVRWSIVSDDGHLERGVLAFAIGVGRPKPVPELGAGGTGPQPANVTARWLFLAGVLAAVGLALFALFARPADEERTALALATAAVLAALGAADESHRVGLDTRAGTALLAGAGLAVLVALTAGAATLERRALRPALVLALPLVGVPTVAGHALDRGLPRVNVAVDLLHVAGASAWVGALLGLVLFRSAAVRLAAGGIALLAVTGVVRALYELLHVSQLWETGYGRALLVKTGLLLLAIGLAVWRRPRLELVVDAVLVGAVAVLVLERPGRNAPAATARAPIPSQPQPSPPAPPRDAVIAAREAGPYGVALELEPARSTVIVLSPSGGGASGLPVTIDGTEAAACGSGCYRVEGVPGDTTDVVVDGRRARFTVAADAPDATAAIRAFERRYRAFDSVEYVERLASDPTNVVVSSWRLEAPDKVRYSIAGGGDAIVIGTHRWDRNAPDGKWVESPQARLTQPDPPWSFAANAHLVAPHTITFADPTIPAFFELTLRPDGKPHVIRMTAAAHFMTDSYVRFDSGQPLRPPR